MAIKVQRKADSQGLSKEQVVSEFRTALVNNSDVYEKSEIEELAALHAKSTTDNFIVSDKDAATRSLKQGDILIYGTESKYYLAVKDTISNKQPASSMNLQNGEAITGAHRVVPIKGAKLTIENAMFTPLDNITRGRKYQCKLIKSDKPFALTHQEHGNMTFPAGEYMAFTALDPRTQQRVID